MAIVTELVGDRDAHRFGALLFTGIIGIISAELNGHLRVSLVPADEPRQWCPPAACHPRADRS